MDEPLEEVGDVEGNSRVLLNFVESDGLSRVRVCHVGFTPLTPFIELLSEFKAGEKGDTASLNERRFVYSRRPERYWQTWVY